MDADPLVVRPASRDDIETVVRSFEWLFAPPGSRPPGRDEQVAAGRLGRMVSAKGSTTLVAVSEEKIVGFCTTYLDIESVRFGRRAWMEDLAVDPGRRSQGIGKLLLENVRNWARDHGAARLALDSGEARVDAHRFYEREQPAYRSKSFGWWL